MKYLKKNTFYMNPFTGSVACGEEWESDYQDQKETDETWEEWGGESLIEVKKVEDEWVEVD